MTRHGGCAWCFSGSEQVTSPTLAPSFSCKRDVEGSGLHCMAKSKGRNGGPPAVCTQTLLDEPVLFHQVLQGSSRAGCIPSAGPSLLCWKLCNPPDLGGTLWGMLASAASTQEDTSSAKSKH